MSGKRAALVGAVHESLEACRRAAASGDRRFDGRFVVGVRSTGIYCRPSCPAPAPRPEHVVFYASAAEARVHGLRACLRCRPDETPTDLGLARRALAAVAAGRDPVPETGLGAGALRRLLVRAAGTTPARVRRELEAGRLTATLPYEPPFAFGAALAYLRPRAVPGVEEAGPARYRRVLRTASGTCVVTVEARADDALRLSLEPPLAAELPAAAAAARRAFDLDARPAAVAAALSGDPVLGPRLRAAPGLRVTGGMDPFELAVRAVLGQQVSVAGATTLAGRLVERFGVPLGESTGRLTHAFPAPERLAEAPLEAIGLPSARAAAVRALAATAAGGALSAPLDPDALRAALLDLPGIGPWTAEYVAMRAAGDPDAWPASDLGLRRALGNGTPAAPAAVAAAGERWRPWRSYAAMLLWHDPAAA